MRDYGVGMTGRSLARGDVENLKIDLTHRIPVGSLVMKCRRFIGEKLYHVQLADALRQIKQKGEIPY
jgi:hypothetical protein